MSLLKQGIFLFIISALDSNFSLNLDPVTCKHKQKLNIAYLTSWQNSIFGYKIKNNWGW